MIGIIGARARDGKAALKLDGTVADVDARLGVARGMGHFDGVRAEQEFRRALELSPASPTVPFYYGTHRLRSMGWLDEAGRT